MLMEGLAVMGSHLLLFILLRAKKLSNSFYHLLCKQLFIRTFTLLALIIALLGIV
jgi:hypothetical protein